MRRPGNYRTIDDGTSPIAISFMGQPCETLWWWIASKATRGKWLENDVNYPMWSRIWIRHGSGRFVISCTCNVPERTVTLLMWIKMNEMFENHYCLKYQLHSTYSYLVRIELWPAQTSLISLHLKHSSPPPNSSNPSLRLYIVIPSSSRSTSFSCSLFSHSACRSFSFSLHLKHSSSTHISDTQFTFYIVIPCFSRFTLFLGLLLHGILGESLPSLFIRTLLVEEVICYCKYQFQIFI